MVKIGILQLKVRSTEENLNKIEEMLTQLNTQNVDIVSLPEKWNAFSSKEQLEEENGRIYNFLSTMAKKFKIYLIGGAITVKSNEENYVIGYTFDRTGKCIGAQRKIHLYSFENKYAQSGSELEIINTEFGPIGVAICFDLNAFPEIGRAFALNGVNLIFNPSMIPADGIENWHIYLKARALENRMPIIGMNPVGKAASGYSLTGQSLIIGFYKGHRSPAKLKIIPGKKNEEEIIIADIDLSYPQELRKNRLTHMKSFTIKKS